MTPGSYYVRVKRPSKYTISGKHHLGCRGAKVACSGARPTLPPLFGFEAFGDDLVRNGATAVHRLFMCSPHESSGDSFLAGLTAVGYDRCPKFASDHYPWGPSETVNLDFCAASPKASTTMPGRWEA